MKHASQHRIRDLIERLARINSADEWNDDLNPTQWTALSYLARANRFSRAPSQVAEFMAATRGTVSQTLKALARKEMITEARSEVDRRWISYDVTAKGMRALSSSTVIDEALKGIQASKITLLADGLESLVREALKARGKKPFGQCKSCKHYRKKQTGGFCSLLNETLKPEETLQICHEHLAAA